MDKPIFLKTVVFFTTVPLKKYGIELNEPEFLRIQFLTTPPSISRAHLLALSTVNPISLKNELSLLSPVTLSRLSVPTLFCATPAPESTVFLI